MQRPFAPEAHFQNLSDILATDRLTAKRTWLPLKSRFRRMRVVFASGPLCVMKFKWNDSSLRVHAEA